MFIAYFNIKRSFSFLQRILSEGKVEIITAHGLKKGLRIETTLNKIL